MCEMHSVPIWDARTISDFKLAIALPRRLHLLLPILRLGHCFILWVFRECRGTVEGLSDHAQRTILASMAAILSSAKVGSIWQVRIAWPNGAVHYFGKFTAEQDAIDWINAHPGLGRPEDTMDEP
jgi:hypothetical protein